MGLLRLWLLGLLHPREAFDELKTKPAPSWGLKAVLIRFVGGSFFGAIFLLLLPNRIPFERPYFTLLNQDTYYVAQTLFLPLFGIMIWLLMSSVAHVILRFSEKMSQFDQILNIVGLGMLIPMPIVWVWDNAMIALNAYQIVVMSTSHVIFQSWEIIIESMGINRILGIKPLAALGLSSLINIIFILGAMLFIR